MTTATYRLYDILVDKGVDRTVAREALDEFLTKETALQTLATKEDIKEVRKEIQSLTKWVSGLIIGQFVATVGALGSLIVYLQ